MCCNTNRTRTTFSGYTLLIIIFTGPSDPFLDLPRKCSFSSFISFSVFLLQLLIVVISTLQEMILVPRTIGKVHGGIAASILTQVKLCTFFKKIYS